ncbi:hypothetical protein OCU04_007311 [Sclerotinia nivalis]|uniref:Uncharacterized protein n=1 Tax=Sclerotinia nivalis TaxID=352851 RepID=A0A9X0AQ07_9HELO|nr:hypothetical protein OCU04_007311 [Sclerotinia nivalis]
MLPRKTWIFKNSPAQIPRVALATLNLAYARHKSHVEDAQGLIVKTLMRINRKCPFMEISPASLQSAERIPSVFERLGYSFILHD